MSIWEMVKAGGFAMLPLGIASILTWVIIFERFWVYRGLRAALAAFHLEATNALLRRDWKGLQALCDRRPDLPTAHLVSVAAERLQSDDLRLRERWREALERRRQLVNQELRGALWVLGTIASATPFIGLIGTVVGILRSFQEMARTGAGGFAVVAAGISEALIATAAGIIVAVIAVLAFNAFQVRWQSLILTIRLQTEELVELMGVVAGGDADQ